MMRKLLLGMATVALAANAVVANPVSKKLDSSKLVVKEWGGKLSRSKIVEGRAVAPATLHRAPAAMQSLVYSEDFEKFNQTTLVPEGWVIINESTRIMGCGLLQGLDPYSGGAYLLSAYDSNAPRNAWAISNGVSLEAGTTYQVGIYAYAPGYNGVKDEWKLTVGTEQTSSAQTTVVIDRTGSKAQSLTDWTLCTGSFTPAVSGTYYWGIHHCTPVADVDAVAFDLFQVDTERIKVLPKGGMYSIGGLWSLDGFMTDTLGNRLLPTAYLTSDMPLQYGYVAENCESVEWDFGEYAVNPTSTVANPVVKYAFPEDSLYSDAVLVMKNADGESYATRSFNIKNLYSSLGYIDALSNLKPEDGLYMIPISETNQYITLFGLQTDYAKMAELYSFPKDMKLTIGGFYLMVGMYKMNALNKLKTFKVTIYNVDANGMPGDSIYVTTAAIKDVFGNNAISNLRLVALPFETPVNVTGSFFIGMEFPSITPSASNCLGLVTSGPRDWNDNSMYMYNDTTLQGISKGWYSAPEMYGANVSAAIYPLLRSEASGVKASKVDNGSFVYANGKELNIVNAALDSDVTVTDVAGRTVWAGKVTNSVKFAVNTHLNGGIYIVTVGGKSTKVVIR